MDVFVATGLNTEMTAHDLLLRQGVPIEAPFLGIRSLLSGLERLGLAERIQFCDAYNLRLSTADVVARAELAAPRIVAVGALYDQWDRGFSTIPEHGTRHLMLRLREALPRATILFGGRAAAATTIDEILDTGVDAVFLGEHDHSFPEVVRRLLEGQALPEAVRGFAGISFRAAGRIERSFAFPMVADLSSIPPPRVARMGRSLFTHDQRGCLATCTYCSAKNNIRGADGRQAMRYFDLEELKAEFAAQLEARDLPHVERIYLTANTFFSDRRRGWELLDWLLKSCDATIGCTITPQDALDPYMWEKLLSVADPQRLDLAMGVESLCAKVLKLFGRPVKPPQLLDILRRFSEAGYTNLTLFYIGIDPFRTLEDLREEHRTLFSLETEPRLLLQTVWQLEEFYRHLVFYPATPLERLARPYESWQLAYKYLMEPLIFVRRELPLKLAPLLARAERSSLPRDVKARLVSAAFPPMLAWLRDFFDSALEAAAGWGSEPVLRPELSLEADKIPNKGFSLLLSQSMCGSELPFTEAFATRLRERYALLRRLGLEDPLSRV
jgi:radical SAM superfamily enzyme YgiQ (UPF0313 family)